MELESSGRASEQAYITEILGGVSGRHEFSPPEPIVRYEIDERAEEDSQIGDFLSNIGGSVLESASIFFNDGAGDPEHDSVYEWLDSELETNPESTALNCIAVNRGALALPKKLQQGDLLLLFPPVKPMTARGRLRTEARQIRTAKKKKMQLMCLRSVMTVTLSRGSRMTARYLAKRRTPIPTSSENRSIADSMRSISGDTPSLLSMLDRRAKRSPLKGVWKSSAAEKRQISPRSSSKHKKTHQQGHRSKFKSPVRNRIVSQSGETFHAGSALESDLDTSVYSTGISSPSHKFVSVLAPSAPSSNMPSTPSFLSSFRGRRMYENVTCAPFSPLVSPGKKSSPRKVISTNQSGEQMLLVGKQELPGSQLSGATASVSIGSSRSCHVTVRMPSVGNSAAVDGL